LVLINEPPFDRFPAFRDKNDTNATKQLYIDHNTILLTKFNENYSPSNTRLNIQLFNSYSFISNVIDNYTNYGFENLESCWDTITDSTVQVVCQNITKRMFCDEYHLSSQMQSFLAQEFYRVMAAGMYSTIYQNITNKISINLNLFIFVLIIIFLSQ
jgi:phospholipase/lecithinase/hemolysin